MTSSHTSRNDVLAKIEKARQHVFALCKGDERWTMRVPANPERDSDLLICDALNAAEKFIQSETRKGGDTMEWDLVVTELCHQIGAQDGADMVSLLWDAVRDAKRYRHLRAHWSDFTGYDSREPGPWLDKTIDAVLDAGQKAPL